MILLDSVNAVLSELGAQASTGGFWMRTLLNALALMVAAHFLKGVQIRSFVTALIVAAVIALLNSTLGILLDFITAPLNWLSLGFFAFIVDAFILRITDRLMDGIKIDTFGWALILAILLSVLNGVFLWLI